MIKIFITWFVSFVSLAVGLLSQNIYIKVILTTLAVVLVLYSEKRLDEEYIKYHESKK